MDKGKSSPSPESDPVSEQSPTKKQRTVPAAAAVTPQGGKFLKKEGSHNEHTVQYHDLNGDNIKTYVKIPVLTTEHHYCGAKGKWIDAVVGTLSSRDSDKAGTVRRLTKALVRWDRSAVLDGLEDMNVRVVRPMDAVTEAAMWKAGQVRSRTARRTLRRHLRYHLGRDIFPPERVVMAMNEGHVPVHTGTAKYNKGDGEKPEIIEYSVKDVAREVERLTESMMQAHDILPLHVARIDVTTGGDHGKGALQQGIRLTLVVKDEVELESPDDDDEKAVTTDSIVAEVICKKDKAEVLELTVNSQLVEALREIADGKLEITPTMPGKVKCTFIPHAQPTNNIAVRINLYVVSDLAFYGTVLGRESMMGAWCYLCLLARRGFQDLLSPGRAWSWSELNKLAAEVNQPHFKGDSKMGVKASPLWSFIPLKNFLPPLLHILIGIWNDIWDKFRELVSEVIEYIPRDEADLRARKESITKKRADLRAACDAWKMTEPGKELERAKGKRTRLRKALKDCRDLNNIVGVAEGAARSSVADLLEALDSFIEEDVLVDEVVEGVFEDELVEGEDDVDPSEPVESANAVVQDKIDEIKERLREVEVDVENRERTFNHFSTALRRAGNMLTKTNEAIKASKSTRRQSGDGIESQLFGWMKILFRVQQPAYHGGKLIGKDCMKMMTNAHAMFTHFALILKRNKKTNCKYSDPMILSVWGELNF